MVFIRKGLFAHIRVLTAAMWCLDLNELSLKIFHVTVINWRKSWCDYTTVEYNVETVNVSIVVMTRIRITKWNGVV